MSNIKKIDPIQEALVITWLEDMTASENDGLFLSLPTAHSINIPADKKQLMVDRLYERMAVLSFGELLIQSISSNHLSMEDISTTTSLKKSIIEELQTDKIAVNNIPVFILKKLLDQLKLSVADVKSAILKSFQIIKNNSIENEEHFSISPAFRKGVTEGSGNLVKRLPNKDLFENEESLHKYLDKLDELMK